MRWLAMLMAICLSPSAINVLAIYVTRAVIVTCSPKHVKWCITIDPGYVLRGLLLSLGIQLLDTSPI